MTDAVSALTLIERASRPFKKFSVTIGTGEDVVTMTLKARRPSAAQSLELQGIYNAEFTQAEIELTEDGADLSALRRSFTRYSPEKLVGFIQQSDRNEYLAEASTEFDDKPYTDPKVIKRADEIQEEQKQHLLKAPYEELVDQAMDRRAFIMATIRASRLQNETFVAKTIYNMDETPFAESVEQLREKLTNEDVLELLKAAGAAFGVSNDNPLTTPAKKSSKERTSSPKPLAED